MMRWLVMMHDMVTMLNNVTFMTNRVMGLGHRHSCHGKENNSQQ